MKHDVRVGVSGQSAVERHANAAEHDVIAVAELMDVEAEAGPDVAEFRKLDGFCTGEVFVRGELHVGGFSLEGDDLEPGPFRKCGIVGEIVPARRRGTPVRIQYSVESKGLRRLHKPQLRAVERAGHDAGGIDGLDRIGDRDGRNGCAGLRRGFDRPRDQRR